MSETNDTSTENVYRYSNQTPETIPMEGLLFLELSYGRQPELFRLEANIKDIGLIRPPLAAKTKSGFTIILSGSRRVQALKNLGFSTVPVIILPPKKGERPCYTHPYHKDAKLYPSQIEIALVENIFRGYNNAETIMAAAFLKNLPKTLAKERILTLLGLKAPQLLESAASSVSLPENILDAFASGQIGLTDLNLMGNFSKEEKLEIFRLFIRLRPSHQKRKQWLDYLDDIKSRDNRDMAVFLNDEFKIYDTFDKEQAARDKLFAIRFPKLASVIKHRQELIDSLMLPKGVSFSVDNTMEDQAAVLRLDFSSPEQLREQLNELMAKLLSSVRLNKIFSSEWEV
jgi:hypothetical protein